MADDRPPARDEARPWTRINEYIVSLARLRSARRAHSVKPRTQPEEPRFVLSTLPFMLLMTALLVIAVAIFLAAWPGSRPQPQPKPEVSEQGVAKRGWLEDAEREFR
ncbi:MAG: hypothetical protein ABIS39_08775 [Sphingomicrobium sp.]